MSVSKRFFAGFGAALFLITSSALTVAVIISLTSSSNNSTNNSTTTKPASSSCKNNSIAQIGFSAGSKLPGFTDQTTAYQKLTYADVSKGTGDVVSTGATITADYVGLLAKTGVIFDDSAIHKGAQTFSLNGVIVGWQEGIPGMRVCGTRELFIPAADGYGAQGSGSIPPNSDLVFYVQVDKID